MLQSVLDYISGTNLFNFIIFASILAYCFIKLDISGSLEKAKDEIRENIEDSESAKAESEVRLVNIDEKVSHLQDEVDEIIKSSLENAEFVGNKIIADTDKAVKNVTENTEKIIENKINLLRNDIMQRASRASVLAAKDHIVYELNHNYDLHMKLIDESVDAIDGVEL